MAGSSATPTLVSAPRSRPASMSSGAGNGADLTTTSTATKLDGSTAGDGAEVFSKESDVEQAKEYTYEGNGTAEAPYIVRFEEGDTANPFEWSKLKRWSIVMCISGSVLVIALGSSLLVGGFAQMIRFFGVSQEVITVGLSLYVFGFALGPLLWAPFSEMYGRRPVFVVTYGLFFVFHIGCALSQNIETLLVCRFLAGFFGSSPLTNSGGVISDTFNASERALALSMFALAPFAGPVLGPIIGGYMGANVNWRWLFWLLTAISGVMWVLGSLIPETYAPVLLRRRALKLSQESGKHYVSFLDLKLNVNETLLHKLKVNVSRPFVLLFKELIVLLFAIYAAITYGTLYLMFGAYPIIFQRERGWGQGAAGLPFIGIGMGMLAGIIINIFVNKKYVRDLEENGGSLPPEARLPICCVGGVALPIGLFWFAWTTQPSVHYMVPIVGSIPFGLGMVLLFLAMTNYMVDSYTLFAASALAANAVLRSVFGAVFPLFTRQLFNGLGTQWALTLIAFITLVLAPVPFLFLRYGAQIRARSTFAPGHKAPSLHKIPTRNEQDIDDEVRMADLARAASYMEDTRARHHQ